MAMCCPDALLAAQTLPWRHVLVLAAINGRDHAEGRIPIRRVQAKTKMRPSTISAILGDLEAEGGELGAPWIPVDHPGHRRLGLHLRAGPRTAL